MEDARANLHRTERSVRSRCSSTVVLVVELRRPPRLSPPREMAWVVDGWSPLRHYCIFWSKGDQLKLRCPPMQSPFIPPGLDAKREAVGLLLGVCGSFFRRSWRWCGGEFFAPSGTSLATVDLALVGSFCSGPDCNLLCVLGSFI